MQHLQTLQIFVELWYEKKITWETLFDTAKKLDLTSGDIARMCHQCNIEKNRKIEIKLKDLEYELETSKLKNEENNYIRKILATRTNIRHKWRIMNSICGITQRYGEIKNILNEKGKLLDGHNMVNFINGYFLKSQEMFLKWYTG